jgi:hypothetical protein
MTVVALFVDAKGIYPEVLGAENCWDEKRDARTYAGPYPVVAHPPCHLWVNLAAVNYKRALNEPNRKLVLPAWYPGGTDGGCFAAALAAVRRCGGVLEHPAGSHAWEAHGLFAPIDTGALTPTQVAFGYSGWTNCSTFTEVNRYGSFGRLYWVCEVWQSAYGHGARKRTWLLYCGKRPPFELNWARKPGTHQCGWFDRKKPTLSKRLASATPVAFADTLTRLAEWSRLP